MTRHSILLLPLAAAVLTASEIPAWLPLPRETVERLAVVPAAEVPHGPAETPQQFKTERSLNGTWKLSPLENSAVPFAEAPEQIRQYAAPEFDASAWSDIEVPLDWYGKFPDKQVKDKPYVRGWYRTAFRLTAAERRERRVILKFDAAGSDATVYLNGRELGSHRGDFTPFEFDATEAAREGENILAVRIVSELGTTFGIKKAALPYGPQWSGGCLKGGLWQQVRLSLEPELRISKLFITPQLKSKSIEVAYTVVNHTGKAQSVSFAGQVSPAVTGDERRIIGDVSVPGTVPPGISRGNVTIPLDHPVQWEPDNPWLYYLNFRILKDGRTFSGDLRRFGFREFRVENRRFHLNGKPVYLFGQNLNSVNYGGKLTPAGDRQRLENDIRRIKSLGCNIVRTPHMPILPEALDLCDEYGLMVYYEWAWAFDTQLAPEFEKNDLAGVAEFVETGYNHPSVVMWCLGNELRHTDRPDIVRLLDRQVALVRSLDHSRRPVSTFSGAAGWQSYGRNKLETDVLDFHTYTSLYGAWTQMPDVFRRISGGLEEIYGTGFPQALVAWENVGFSWGARPDPSFRRGDRKLYAEQMRKPTSWGAPNGVGFVGTSPLFKALAPGFGEWAQTRFGHRIFEYYRLNPDYAGFSPWFEPIPASTLWNQPVYPSLCNADKLFPHNLFSGEESRWELTVVNDGPTPYENLTLALSVFDGKEELPLMELSVLPLPAHDRRSRSVSLVFPANIGTGFRQLRLALKQEGKLIGRNFYDVFIGNRAELERRIETARPVRLFDTGAPGNVRELQALFTRLHIPFETISAIGEAPAGALVAVPPELHESQTLALAGPELMEWIQRKGGTLLVMEQKNPLSVYPGGRRLTADSAAYVDMVLPQHPVFRGMDYRNLESWSNPDHAYVVDFSFMPYTEDALAVKGPLFSHSNAGVALTELKSGSGRLIFSQLNAVRCAPGDPSAALYLRNLLEYAAGNAYVQDAPELELEADRDYCIDETKALRIDLAPYANRSFRDDVSGDGKGGWTDEGENDFRTMPLGSVRAAGIPFRILDPAENNGVSCLVLRGTQRPHFPAAITGIRINEKLSRVFFLHTSTWGGSNRAGAYRFHYEDGTTVDCLLQGGGNIGDWWNIFSLPDARIGIERKNPQNQTVACYVTEWENPKPELRIVSMDFLSLAALQTGEIDWNPENAAIPVLVAATAEKSNPDRAVLTAADTFSAARGIQEVNSQVSGSVTVRRESDGGANLSVHFPAYSGTDVPGVWISYRKEALRGPYFSLSCDIRSRQGGTIQFRLPCDGWRDYWTAYCRVPGDNQWHRYRLFFNRDFKSRSGGGDTPIDFDRLRNELFLFSRAEFNLSGEVAVHDFEIKNIVLN